MQGTREAEGNAETEADAKIRLFSSLLFFFVSLLLSRPVFAEHWKELKGDHFIIYYRGNDRFVKDALRKAEFYYEQISSDLGFLRYSNFWQWENRVKIHIYSTQEDYLRETNEPAWSQGVANYTRKEIQSYLWSEGFLEGLLPHEIAHLIFRDYVGFKGEVPLWLDEGVAQWVEPAKRTIVRATMKSVFEKGEAYSLQELTVFALRHTMETKEATRFYIQAASVIDFLIGQYGSDNFLAFCRELRDGKTLEEALRFTYPTSMRNLSELEEKWKKYILSAPG